MVLELIFTIIDDREMIDIIKDKNARFEITKYELNPKKTNNN